MASEIDNASGIDNAREIGIQCRAPYTWGYTGGIEPARGNRGAFSQDFS